ARSCPWLWGGEGRDASRSSLGRSVSNQDDEKRLPFARKIEHCSNMTHTALDPTGRASLEGARGLAAIRIGIGLIQGLVL
ncbi:hypothetical protein, partial [Klebsiella variicola]|uniref:hypothetical protein n=1 Tax=Klebsiella variicola TaxID=244366 RepID=UPI00272F2D78